MRRLACFVATASAIIACAARPAVSIENAWARATPPNSTVAVVYAEIVAGQTDELVAITSPSAERIEVHSSVQENGVMKMRPVQTVRLRANQPVKFETGGLHLMLIGLRAPLVANTSVSLTFNFRSAAPVTIAAKVVAPGGDGHAH